MMDHTFTFRDGTGDEGIFRAINVGDENRLPDLLHQDNHIIDISTRIGSFSYAAAARGMFMFLSRFGRITSARRATRQRSPTWGMS